MSRRLFLEIGSLAAVALVALAVRLWGVGIYLIPSESMLPRLWPGDIVAVWKWPFRVAHRLPRRGEVVMFRAPPTLARTYVKRVIGLPGDRVALRHGILILNGRAVPRWRIADLLVPVTPATPCRPPPDSLMRREREPDGQHACRYPRFRELPPGGQPIDILDLGYTDGDDFGPTVVPAGRLFLLGDNRDQSADSRWPAGTLGAVGMVPIADVVGAAGVTLLSLDGTSRWRDPASWGRGIRWDRVGRGF